MKYPAYPQYKDSGVAWLGEIPAHWQVKRLSYLALLKSGENITSEQIAEGGDYPVYGGNGLRGFYSAYTHEGFYALIGRQGALCGNVNYANGKFWASEHAIVVTPITSFVSKWLGELLRAMNLNQYSVSAAQPGLSVSMIASLKIPVPPCPEQTAIADFLDSETGRIDTLVAKKRKLVELLKEKRSALISRTVTRGLPADMAGEFGLEPNKGFKQSGIEWLGNIPLHWGIQKFSRCAFFQEGPGLRNWQFTQDGVRVICVTNITDSGINFSNYGKFISDEEYQTSYRHFTVSNGDLLLSSSGNSWGKVAEFQSNEIAILNTSTIRINTNVSGTLVRAFVKWLLISDGTREQLGQFMTGSCQPNFGPSHLGRVLVTVPPQVEQTAIATYLDRETAKIDRLLAKVETAIARLQEYRSALITAAVTGKIDVRGTA